jgi:uncharacterized membrane protein YfcA
MAPVSLLCVPTSILQDLAIFGAGIAAGTINVIVGSGTLITFPTLLAFGFPPVLANVSNNIGIIPGSVSGVYGYRAELFGQRNRTIKLGTASLCGGLVGAILLLVLPADAFQAIVPTLIGIALVMVVVQPRLARWVAARRTHASAGDTAAEGSADPVKADAGGPLLWCLVFCTGIYGGYFGAAQGVLLIGLLGVALGDSLQRVNAVKNILAALVNGVAAVVFIIVSHIAWGPAALIALGSVIGGQAGAKVGRKLPPWGLRALIVCVGIAALAKLLA